MQALPFTSSEGLALTLLSNPPMDIGILTETCKKKTKHNDYNAKILIIYHLMHLPAISNTLI